MAASWVIVLQFLYLFVLSTLAADTYFIDSFVGVDDNNCTYVSNPCQTLEHVLELDADMIHFLSNYTLTSADAPYDITGKLLTSVGEVITCSENYTATSKVFETRGSTSLIDISISGCPGLVLSADGATLGIIALSIVESGQPLFAFNSALTIEESVFRVSAESEHPAVILSDSAATIITSDFSDNMPNNLVSYPAAALAIVYSSVKINSTDFSGCVANGATIYISESTVTFGNCDINNNVGTGILAKSGSVVNVENSRITNNIANLQQGGGIEFDESDFNIVGSTITENSATSGAGVYVNGSRGHISGSFIAMNTANIGSGIYLDGNVTITGGIVEDIHFASEVSTRTLRVKDTQMTYTGDQAFCCSSGGFYNDTLGSMVSTVCNYPACNAAQCGLPAGSGCDCPLEIQDDQEAVAEDFCKCQGINTGPFCTKADCSAGLYESCSNRGVCDSFKGCTCSETFYGTNCSNYCAAEVTCNGNGLCNDNGICQCNAAFTGRNCNRPIYLGGTTGSPTRAPTNEPTIPASSTSGRIITGDCRVAAYISQRQYASWTEDGVTYSLWDIYLENTGSAAITNLRLVIANASVSSTWNLDYLQDVQDVNATYSSAEYYANIPSLFPGTTYAALGLINEGLSAPTIVSLSCNSTDERAYTICNGVKINHSIRRATINDGEIITEYDMYLTNNGLYSVISLQLEISGTEGTSVRSYSNMHKINENNIFTLDGVQSIRVGQTVSGYSFNLAGRGAALVRCANSEIITGDELRVSENKSNRRRDGAIAGGVIGGVILLALIIALAFFITRRRRHMVAIPSFERTSVVKKPRFGIESFGDGYDKSSNPSAADQNL